MIPHTSVMLTQERLTESPIEIKQKFQDSEKP